MNRPTRLTTTTHHTPRRLSHYRRSRLSHEVVERAGLVKHRVRRRLLLPGSRRRGFLLEAEAHALEQVEAVLLAPAALFFLQAGLDGKAEAGEGVFGGGGGGGG